MSVEFGAYITPDQRYRYELTRRWDRTLPTVVWVMLNPSTADADMDDPTIRRCMGFARSWGCGAIRVVNLYALRSPDPNHLWLYDDPVGPDNDRFIRMAFEFVDGPVVFAWGGSAKRGREREVLSIAHDMDVRPVCLGKTIAGSPRHPLYLKATTSLVSFGAFDE